jgi:hypothetical protein
MKIEIDDNETLTIIMDEQEYTLKKDSVGFRLFKTVYDGELQSLIYQEK